MISICYLISKRILTMLVGVGCLWTLSPFQLSGVAAPNARIGIKAASANSHYGILGQPAPEIQLDTWINGNGKDIAPIDLRDYRGKVIYLYFFQDW